MITPGLVLIGAGGHARACIDVIESQAKYRIIGLVGKIGGASGSLLGYPMLGVDDELSTIVQGHDKGSIFALIGVGQIQSPDIRIQLFQRSQSLGLTCQAIVSPTAYVSPHAELGEGTIVMHGAIVNAGARVGSNCIINSLALIEHDAQVVDHCHISTAAVVNGGAFIGSGSFLGSRCVVREGVRIGERCLVGMGITLRHDLADGSCLLK